MNAKRKGTRNEHRSMLLLEATGYRCTRAAASLGAYPTHHQKRKDIPMILHEHITAERARTYYSAVHALEEFWDAVASFEELKAREGKFSATCFMTNCVMLSAARGSLQDCTELVRFTAEQGAAYRALVKFLAAVKGYPDREAVAFESVWITADV
jgi:hypothetical protein